LGYKLRNNHVLVIRKNNNIKYIQKVVSVSAAPYFKIAYLIQVPDTQRFIEFL